MTGATAGLSVEGVLPGPELGFALSAVDLSAVDEFGVVEVLKAGRRLASWAASLAVRAAAELGRRGVASDGDRAGRLVAPEIGAGLTLASAAAGDLLLLRRAVADRPPPTL